MADLIWKYGNKELPHIHAKREHVDNTILLAPSYGQGAKTNKLLSKEFYIKNQFAPTKSSSKDLLRLINDITDPSILEKIEQSLQEQLAEQDNKKFELVSNATDLDQALKNLKTVMRRSQVADGKKFIEAFDGLMSLIDKDVPSIQLWSSIINHPEDGVVVNSHDIVAIDELRQAMRKYLDSISATGSLGIAKEAALALFNVISSIISENYYTGIQQIEKNAEFTVSEAFKAVKANPGPSDVLKTGTQTGDRIESTDLITIGRLEKAADSIAKKHVKVAYGNEKYTFEVTVPTSMKYYVRQNTRWVHLSQYSGKNSILMDSLHDIYGSNWDAETQYAIYNALAFSHSSRRNDVIEKNFKIIKHDLIMRTAYIYLAGSKKSLGQRVFIYNSRAYPVINILQAIIDKESNTEDVFQRSNKDKYFDIEISGVGDKINRWIDTRGNAIDVARSDTKNLVPNRAKATRRIENVIAACDVAQTRGKVKTSVLSEKILKEYIKFVPGIKIDIV